jgi:xanthine dehydrogenase molybdopterin-binding subunit B
MFQEIPGVVAFLSAKDIPGKNTFTPLGLMSIVEEEEVSCLCCHKQGW